MSGFVKIYGSKLITSSLWDEAPEARLVFLGMLAMADAGGFVDIPNETALARMLNLDVDYVNRALAVLMAPDPGSRTKANDGKRIVRDGPGWRCVNYENYREFRTKTQEKTRERVARFRAKIVTSNTCNDVKRAEAEAEAEAEKEQTRPAPAAPKSPAPLAPTVDPAAPVDFVPVATKYTKSFLDVWERSGRRGSKFKGWKAWGKAKSPPWSALALPWASYMASERPAAGFVKDLSTWLNERGWEQEWPAGQKAGRTGRAETDRTPAKEPLPPRCSHHEKSPRFRNPHPVDWCPGCREQVAREGTRTMTTDEILQPPDWAVAAKGETT